MAQAAYTGWKNDMLAGKTTLLAAADGTDVTELAAQARADRVAAGQVEPGGVRLQDGNLAGVGDWIVTRLNDRRLSVFGGRDWVKNGDAWHVERRHADGSLTVRGIGHGGRVTLPAAYVRDQVQLLYATTAHRAEGTTVDTAHPLITAGMTREALYVLATRARESTVFYVATHDLPFDEDDHVNRVRSDPRQYAAREILLGILATEGAVVSATETITTAQEEAGSLATLVPRYLHAAHLDAETRYRAAAAGVLGSGMGSSLVTDPAWGAVVRRLYDAETNGWEPDRLLATVAAQRELGSADSIAEVIAWRIDGFLAANPEPPAPRPAAAPAAPAAATKPADGTTPAPGCRPYESAAAARDRLAAIAAETLGPRLAGRARSETAWPALLAGLRRAESAGHDPAAALSSVVSARELRTARSISETLAWRIGRYLAATPDPDHAADQAETPAGGSAPASSAPTDPLPWVASPPTAPADGENAPLARYLNDAAALITARISELADTAVRHRPPWMSLLGQPPADPGRASEWLRHVGVIVAYRDQYKVTSDDPRQVLGPYAEPGHAGHAAYWHAAESVLAARRLAGLEPASTTASEDGRARARLAADIYRALAHGEREAIATEIAATPSSIWLGDPAIPDEHAAAQRAYADRLIAALTKRGHMTAISDPARLQHQHDRPLEADLARRGRGSNRGRTAAPTSEPTRQPLLEPPLRHTPALAKGPQHVPR